MIDSAGNAGRYPSIDYNPLVGLAVSYYEATGGNLKFADRIGAIWNPQLVDTAGNVDQYSSISIDQAGFRYISYYDATNGDLKLADSQAGIPIPTLSEWGIIILGLLLLAGGTIAIVRRYRAVAPSD